MNNTIQKFEIQGLFGYKDIGISFNDNVMIVIGENGFGKTSILNALSFTLQGEWKLLSNICFDSISITISDIQFAFTKKSLKEYCEHLERMKDDDGKDVSDFVKDNIGEKEYNEIEEIVSEGRKREFFNLIGNHPLLKSIPGNILFNAIFMRYEREKIFKVFGAITQKVKELGCDILYLPTYRRVEVGLDSLQIPRKRNPRFRYEDEDNPISDFNHTMIRFGMGDVQSKIANITKTISQSFVTGYAEASGDMIRQLLKGEHQEHHELTCDRRQMQIVLARIGNSLTTEEKEHILSMVDSQSKDLLDNNYLVYFLEQLLAVYKKQEKYDSAIKSFCKVCNKYLHEKEFIFDESNVTLRIYRKFQDGIHLNDVVQLNQLSSGEKQIVSIFSRIYLDVDKRYIILLDEPELSLSIYWQENLLPDLINSGNCDFLMAVTHSPFIFAQGLKQYTVGIDEFLRLHIDGNS